jgi:PAS domain S-box-containing protein
MRKKRKGSATRDVFDEAIVAGGLTCTAQCDSMLVPRLPRKATTSIGMGTKRQPELSPFANNLALSGVDQEPQQLLRELEQQRRLFDMMLSSLADFACVFDRQARLLYANRATLQLWGKRLEEALGKNLFDLNYEPDVAEKATRQMHQVFETRQEVRDETLYTDSSGECRVYEYTLTPICDEAGEVQAVLGYSYDITNRKASERREAELHGRLEQQTRIFHSSLSSIADFVYVFDRDGRFHYANQALLDLWGLKLEEAVGKNFFDLKYPDELAARLQRQIQQVFDTGKTLSDETPYTSPTGTGGYYEYIFCPVFGDNGTVEVVAGTTRDVTQRKRTEQMLRDSEHRFRALAESLETQVQARTTELEERNTDVQRQADELRDLSARLMQIQDQERRHIARELHDSAGQTLAVLGMNLTRLAQEVKRHAPQSSRIAEESEELIQQLNREIRTTSYLLHPPLLDEAGLASALRMYVRGLVERGTLDVSVDVAEDFGRLPSSLELMLFRIVQESLTNVIGHSGSKNAAIQIRRNAERVELEVRDSGRGIPTEKLADARSSSTGIGIRGMRERVRQFQGQMKIESTPAGTKISAILPIPPQS